MRLSQGCNPTSVRRRSWTIEHKRVVGQKKKAREKVMPSIDYPNPNPNPNTNQWTAKDSCLILKEDPSNLC